MPRPESLARFFKTTPRLDKKLLGDFISRPDQLDVLKSFMHLMEFDGVCVLLSSGRSRNKLIYFGALWIENYLRCDERTFGSFPLAWRVSTD